MSTVGLSGGGLSGAAGTLHTVTGVDTQITGIAFIGSQAYYTSSSAGGGGTFGKLDTATYATTRLLSSLGAAHVLAFFLISSSVV